MRPARRRRLACCCAIAAALAAPGASAERADRDKPIHVEAGRMSADDARRLSVFESNVLFSKGTLSISADRVVVRQDPDGSQHATATGNPVRFKQRAEPKDNQPGLWIEGTALRVEVDAREEKIQLYERVCVTRGPDIVRGDYVLYDQRTEYLSVSGAKNSSEPGRVQVVIQSATAGSNAPPATGEQCPK